MMPLLFLSKMGLPLLWNRPILIKRMTIPLDIGSRTFVTVQNCGVTLDDNGLKKLVTEDIRNGNGRTVKSRFATLNRVDRIDEPIQAIFWIMKDDSLTPLVKINDSLIASTMGCTLMAKRSNAENVIGKHDDLVIEPYANPFRVYPLVEDYRIFRSLFESGVDCYIINTGFYMGREFQKRSV